MSENLASDSYKSISKPSMGIYKELGSKFLSFAYPVSSEEEIKEIISTLKKEHFSARHHCYAYRLGITGETWRANDDGEPSSSAGRPILGQLLSNELSDILVVVVRYFGGTKLGIPGLIRSYKSATIDAIKNGEIIIKIASETICFNFDYTNIEPVMKLLKAFDTNVIKQEFDLRCNFFISIRETQYQNLLTALEEIEGLIITS
ncbi:MAG: YigZ family protein [Bacteroidales bacterium]